MLGIPAAGGDGGVVVSVQCRRSGEQAFSFRSVTDLPGGLGGATALCLGFPDIRAQIFKGTQGLTFLGQSALRSKGEKRHSIVRQFPMRCGSPSHQERPFQLAAPSYF